LECGVSGPDLPKSKSRTHRVTAIALGAAPWVGLAAIAALWVRDHKSLRGELSERIAGSPHAIAAREPGRGRLARAPHDIPIRGWRDICWRTMLEVSRDRLPAVAGGITFYGLLAIFPAIGVFVSLYGLFADVGTVSHDLNQLAVFVPGQVLTLVADQMMRLASRPHVGLSFAFGVTLVLSIWSANAGMQALIEGLNVAYGETEKRNFVVQRALSLGFTVAALVFATAVTGLLVAIPIGVQALGLWDAWLIPFRWVVLFLLAAVSFAVIYRFGPSREEPRWSWVRWGAGAAALIWVGGSLAYSWFLGSFAHYDATYGPLGAVIGFMMWIWFTAMVILVGAELNAEIEHQTARDSTTGAPLPMGARGAEMADTVGAPFEGLRRLFGQTEAKVEARLRGKAAKGELS
jgi:membrane protein